VLVHVAIGVIESVGVGIGNPVAIGVRVKELVGMIVWVADGVCVT
jgi:hypothetical protein